MSDRRAKLERAKHEITMLEIATMEWDVDDFAMILVSTSKTIDLISEVLTELEQQEWLDVIRYHERKKDA